MEGTKRKHKCEPEPEGGLVGDTLQVENPRPSQMDPSISCALGSDHQAEGSKKQKLSKKKKALLYQGTLEESDDSSDWSESSEPIVKDYPVNCDQFTTRSPTLSEVAELEDEVKASTSAPETTASKEMEHVAEEPKPTATEKSEPNLLWEPEEEELQLEELEPDEEEVLIQELRSRFESDR